MRFSLQTKSVTAAAPVPGTSAAPNPAMLRSSNVLMDEGKAWSGDLYTEGAVTDPGSAFAAFSDETTDTEAWLDMGADGTLIGWVRQGDDIYRYLDLESWSMDVDGAGVPRTDGGASPEGVIPAEGEGDELAEEVEGFDPVLDAAAEVDPDAVVPEEATTADAERTIGEQAPTAFEEEVDEAVEEVDPTDPLEDPTDLPDGEDDGGDEADDTFTDLLGDGDVPAAEEDDETLSIAPEDLPTVDGEPLEETIEEEVEEKVDEALDPLDEVPDEDEDEDEEDEATRLKGPNFGKKHAPGEHNQESHGNRVSIGARSPRGRAGAAAAVTGPKPKSSLAQSTIAGMTDSELEGITESGGKFDDETLMAAAVELDERNPIGDTVRSALADAKPGSMEEHNALADIIPREWINWAGRDESSRGKKPTKKETADDEWLSFMETQKLAAGADALGAGLIPARMNKAFMDRYGDVDALFDGRIPHSARNKWLTTEAKDWFDNNFVSKSEFLDGRSTSSKAPGKRVRSSLNEN